jgi:uncharacterized protein (DUF58 family)
VRLGAGRVVVAVFAGAVVLNLLARTSAAPWLALASGAMLALPAVSYVLRPGLRGLSLEQRQVGPVVAGGQVQLRLRLRNAGPRPTPPVTWQHRHPALGHLVGMDLPGLAPGESHELVVQRPALIRGVFTGSAPGELSTLSSTAPFGILRWTVVCPPSGAVVVHPVTGHAALRQDGARTALVSSSVPIAGTGMEVLALRHWQHGDSLRDVSARATARHGRPVVLQRERDAGPALVILAEGGGAGGEWEQLVSATASLALAALEGGRPPTVIAEPAPRRVDALGLLDFFAGVDSSQPLSDAQISGATRRVGRGGSLVLLAPPADQSRLRHIRAVARAGGAHCVVLHG